MSAVPPCPVCGGRDFEPARHIESQISSVPQGLTRSPEVDVEIARCQTCGLEVNAAVLAGADLSHLYTEQSLYSESTYSYRREIYPTYTVDLVAELAQVRPERGRLLEIGFLETDLLARLQSDGWTVQGIDLDRQAVVRARGRGFDVRQASVDHPALDGEAYDAIIAVGVLEHVSDPGQFVRRVRQLLRPGGVVLLQLPNLGSLNARVSAASPHGWDMYGEPGHLYHFRRDHLDRLLAGAGLEEVRYRTATIRVRGKLPLLPGRLPRIERRVAALVHRSRALRAVYSAGLAALDLAGLGDTHVVIARRPEEPA